jgi:hypothetical protein
VVASFWFWISFSKPKPVRVKLNLFGFSFIWKQFFPKIKNHKNRFFYWFSFFYVCFHPLCFLSFFLVPLLHFLRFNYSGYNKLLVLVNKTSISSPFFHFLRSCSVCGHGSL